MNWVGFTKLIHNIFYRDLPDLGAIQAQGLLAVKIAQVFALRIDFLNREKCEHLARLYRSTLPVPSEQVKTLLASHTDAAFSQAFAYIRDEPLAAASVGQVHRARLRSGEEVVVKLIKKDFKDQFARDVRSLKRLFQLMIIFYPKLRKVADPVGILEHIEDYTLRELNLLNEIKGRNTLRDIFLQNRDRYDLSRLAFVEFTPELCSENVLVSQYLAGCTFDELLGKGELAYADLLELFHIQGFYLFCSGTFHGDIHPGNIILNKGTIYFIDTSAVNQVGEKIRKGLFKFFSALCYWEYAQCAEYLNQMSEQEITGRKYDAFKEKFIDLYADFTDSTVSQVSLTQRMMETIKLGVNSGMVFERGIFNIIKSLMYLDGMVLRCNPQAVLMQDMRSFIGETQKLVL